MLIGADGSDLIQLTRRLHNITRWRQEDLKLSHPHNKGHEAAESIKNERRGKEALKLPEIANKGQKNGQMKQARVRRSQKKTHENSKIMQLIQKEISIERQNYFQTISSQRALIVKNTGRSQASLATETQQHREQKDSSIRIERQCVMTPPLKVYRAGKTEACSSLPKTKKKAIVFLEKQESCSPWNFSESEDNCIQEEAREEAVLLVPKGVIFAKD